MQRLSLAGRRFGRLVVKEFVAIGSDIGKSGFQGTQTYWRCNCDCGSVVVVAGPHLNSGHSTSCGCLKKELNRSRGHDLTGKTFGRLVALHRDGVASWLCACNCGNKKVVRTSALVSGFTLSCGCLNRERVSETHRTHGMTGTIEYDRHRVRLRRARRHGNGGQHSVTDVRSLASMQRHRCAGCGAALNMESKNGYNLDHRVPIASGGSNDRANLQLLCPLCNRQKAAKPEHDWQREKFGRLI